MPRHLSLVHSAEPDPGPTWPVHQHPIVQGTGTRRRVVRLETVRLESHPELLFLRLVTRDGLVGLGEAYGTPREVDDYLHEVAAPILLGTPPSRFDQTAGRLFARQADGGTAATRRGASAVDLALWDLAAKTANQPLHELLGGACRDAIRVYSSLPLDWDRTGAPRAAVRLFELAEDLLDRRITAMKVEPFAYVEGSDISAPELKRALQPLHELRDVFGMQMELMLEFHSRWDLRPAKRIARAVEELDPLWLEEPINADDLGAIAAYARWARVPMTLREPLRSRYAIKDLFDRRIAGIVMFSLGWSGGVSEAVRVAALANDYHLPLTLYGRAGPVLLTAATHVAVSAPNALIQETVQDYYTNWYQDVVTELPHMDFGTIAPPTGPGIGTALHPDLLEREGTTVRATSA
ncbi:mandelate racemase/muconate lactonizing enzyme family protein [Tenggerimyces flavus]|uniref:Mandelate racemase/muconate lactonizing enzyme family protein n=1 Tax=Tenggerimyces flavus TaxID=1708749 RepID=A0ABV7Y9F9_9ACTN|nr:mandelate racemase/muconate lactonizing enzyme family protein [Tenggerimyces flavus]MBM7788804.1 L-alanine-DL-glutamate epimerase-like enolase superfamily enzyme [Tenggerimyces flavus]